MSHRSAQRKCIPVAFSSHYWPEKLCWQVCLNVKFYKKSLKEVQWVEEMYRILIKSTGKKLYPPENRSLQARWQWWIDIIKWLPPSCWVILLAKPRCLPVTVASISIYLYCQWRLTLHFDSGVWESYFMPWRWTKGSSASWSV